MRTVGSRELKANLGEVLRQVREEEEVFVVTHRGHRIARIIPESLAATDGRGFDAVWAEMDRLAEKIARDWPEHTSAARAVGDDRREISGG